MAFDPSTLGNLDRYRNMSVVTLTGTIMVGEALLEEMPEGLPEHVVKAGGYLKSAIEEAGQGLTDRLDGKADLALERAFDVLVDRVWAVLRARLEFWHCYNFSGIALLNEEEQAEAEVEKNRKLTAVAKELIARLFGNGLDFLRFPYPQQAAHMAARLRYIETRGLQDEFKELVGAAPVVLAQVCQRRYEAMVKARSARDSAVIVNLKPLRAKVAWAAENYASALLGTLPDEDAEWAKVVLAALQPMVSTTSELLLDGECAAVVLIECSAKPPSVSSIRGRAPRSRRGRMTSYSSTFVAFGHRQTSMQS